MNEKIAKILDGFITGTALKKSYGDAGLIEYTSKHYRVSFFPPLGILNHTVHFKYRKHKLAPWIHKEMHSVDLESLNQVMILRCKFARYQIEPKFISK